MATRANRDLSKLDPKFRVKVEYFLKEVEKIAGDCIFITEAWRSHERQKELLSKWLSKVKRSKHQDWLAIDIAFHDDKRTTQLEKELYPDDMEKRREIADIAKDFEIDWGYDLWKRDKPHLQCNGKEYIIMPKSRLSKVHKMVLSITEKLNWTRWQATSSKHERELLHKINKNIRALLSLHK